jgi:two-component system response regulator NreC
MTRGKRILKVVVADSHNLYRRGLATLIASEADMEVIGEAANAARALTLVSGPTNEGVELIQPDVLVMEIGLVRALNQTALDSGADRTAEDQIAVDQASAEIIKALRQLPESVAILFLAPYESAECLEVTLAAGARGYMLKSAPPAQLIAGIRQATILEDRDAQGLSRQAPDLKALAESERAYPRVSPLTSREQEVMTLLAEGRTVREVAAELSLSIKTIEAHKLNLMRKLDIHNRASLVEYAVRYGLVSAQPVAKQ